MSEIEIPMEDRAQLTVVWSNVNPPLMPTNLARPTLVEDPDLVRVVHTGRTTKRIPALTLWDWNTTPDSLSVGLVVRALTELKITTRRKLNQMVADGEDLSYERLVAMLGENAFVSSEWPDEPVADLETDMAEAVKWVDRSEVPQLDLETGVVPVTHFERPE